MARKEGDSRGLNEGKSKKRSGRRVNPYVASLTPEDLEISPRAYLWTDRAFSLVRKTLSLNINFSGDAKDIEEGDIFLFNHFARFETFIPQYFIYQRTGAFSRSLASAEFFVEGDPFSNYLLSVGAVPHSYPNILEFFAREILRGHKIVIFPEGGMVKDRKVIDDKGKYSVYSSMAKSRRKHHTGAALLALIVDLYRQRLLELIERGKWGRIDEMAERMRVEAGQLFQAAQRPTMIIPANITFYPIRVRDNLLTKGAEWIGAGLNKRITEELLIEGNILLEDTDMDIRLSRSISVRRYHTWWSEFIKHKFLPKVTDLHTLFQQSYKPESMLARAYSLSLKKNAKKVRDEYMHRIYSSTTINLSHLASALILRYLEKNKLKIEIGLFNRLLYLSVKTIQRLDHINLHLSLCNPELYGGILENECSGLNRFLKMAREQSLIDIDDSAIILLEALKIQHGLDEIRLNNLIEVYGNEIAPIHRSLRKIYSCMDQAPNVEARELAMLRLDDERILLSADKATFSKPEHEDLNRQQTATASSEPYLYLADGSSAKRKIGVLLVHGFLASPAELRSFGHRVHDQGYTVYGVRLRGHGTSPWDLRERSYEDWLVSVKQGHDILKLLCDEVIIVGFSTGGALALSFAAENPQLKGVCAINVPFKFQNKTMIFVPLVHHTNRMIKSITSLEGMYPFRANRTENPTVNYLHMPVRGLYELTRLHEHLHEKIPDVKCPVHLVQGDSDPVVVPGVVKTVRKELQLGKNDVTHISSTKHGIVYQNIDRTQDKLLKIIENF